MDIIIMMKQAIPVVQQTTPASNRGTDERANMNISTIAMVNTFSNCIKSDLRGVYHNSPDSEVFDGSDSGYWKRVCLANGVSAEELNQTEKDIVREFRFQQRNTIDRAELTALQTTKLS